MTRHTNILQFEPARTRSRNRREALSAAVPDDRYAGLDYYQNQYGTRTKKSRTNSAALAQGSRRQGAGLDASPSYGKRVDFSSLSGASAAKGKAATKTKAASAQTPESNSQNSRRAQRAQLREQSQRARAKARASNAFDKQYAYASASVADSGPRAAVYKGKMGQRHKQAARMQTEDKKQRASFGFSPLAVFSWLAGLLKKPNAAVLASVAVCAVLAVGFLYPSARTYYQALREEARLELEYSQLLDRNEALSSSVAYLQTDAGIEARARSQYGLVMSGEASGRVSGVDAAESELSIEAKVLSDEVKPPTTWYSVVLDPLFGVES